MAFHRRSLELRPDHTEILSLKLLSFAATPNSDNLRDADGDEVLEELV